MSDILMPAIILGIMGVIFGVGLSIASRVFHVEVDERVERVLGCLPGANCGACGFPGCAGLAEAIASGKAPVNGCAIGGSETAEKVAEVMGVNAGAVERNVALVKCQGTCDKAKNKYDYNGLLDCRLIADYQQGGKSCAYGCVGGGTCVSVCEFDAIHMIEGGIAYVDKEKCVACMKCINICPKKIIALVPYEQKTFVKCKSTDPGKVVRVNCSIGCIGCGLCEKNCPKKCIKVTDNLAEIDYSQCINCGICASVCPTNAIFVEYPERVEKIKEAAKKKAEAKKLEAMKAAEAKKAEQAAKEAVPVDKEEN